MIKQVMIKQVIITVVSVLVIVFVFFRFFYVDHMTSVQDNVVYFASLEYAPYYGADLVEGGFVSEIVKTVFANVGYRMKVDFLPWDRALANSAEGVYNGVYTMWRTEEREESLIFSDPLPNNELVFFVRKGEGILYETLEDLHSYKIGIVTGFAYPDAFLEAGLDLYAVSSQRENISKLISGEIDVLLEDKAVGLHLVQEHLAQHVGKIEIVGEPLTSIPQYVAFSKARPDAVEMVTIFNESLRELVASGEFDSILKKHGYLDLFRI